MKITALLFVAFVTLSCPSVHAQRLQVSENQRYLVTEDGDPFFWLADTAWELFHRLNRQEADMYLRTRAAQGFNVIQAVALAELDGLNTPNAYGELPLTGNDLARPNENYFDHVEWVIRKADSLGMYIGLLPTWGDKLFTNSWGIGPEILNPGNAYDYGKWIGNRFKDEDNIIWIIGGDRNPREGSNDVEVWRQMAEGIALSAGGYENTLMSFHPQPKEDGGSSTWFHADPWLDFNMHQTGHCPNRPTYRNISHDYSLSPTKPVLDGEPLYEDHPNCFNARELGYSMARDIRRIMYWNVFSGAFGQTYGCHDIWQMYSTDREGINHPLRPWDAALQLPMATQVKHLKNLMLSRPFLNRVPDQEMVPQQPISELDYVAATRDSRGTFAMFYFPEGNSAKIRLSALKDGPIQSWWYDPRTGVAFETSLGERSDTLLCNPPSSGPGNDWVLVVDSQSEGYGVPGKN